MDSSRQPQAFEIDDINSFGPITMEVQADTVIIQFFNQLNLVDLKQNTADLKALGNALLGMMRIVGPGPA